MDRSLLNSVCDLVADLARGRYAEVVSDGRAGWMSVADLHDAIDGYGRTLIPLPDTAASLIEVYARYGNPTVCALDVPLWTVEEGRSDLILQLDATKEGGVYRIEITSLHVM